MKIRFIALICLLTIPCTAATITVDDNGPADFNNIQAAIDAANNGDIVEIQLGTYTGTANRNIEIRNKSITIRSTDPNDPNVVAATIIDCENAGRAFWFNAHDANISTILTGLNITNGKTDGGAGVYCICSIPFIANCIITNCHFVNCSAGNESNSYAGGIYCGRGVSAVISNCSFTGNSAPFGSAVAFRYSGSDVVLDNCLITNNVGTAIYCYEASPTITNCTITGNLGRGIVGSGRRSAPIISNCTISGNLDGGLAHCNGSINNCTISNNSANQDGGGIHDCDGLIKNCIITENSSTGIGGGLSYCDGTITNCLIADNSAGGSGGGLAFCLRGSITNCTIANNSAGFGGGISRAYPGITNCIIWGNIAFWYPQIEGSVNPTYSCIQDWTAGGEGNITENPYFSFGTNYHLMPYSPCIDAGTNTPIGGLPPTDLDGNPRPADGNDDGIAVADMGAYEFQEPNSPLIAFMPTEFEFHYYINGPNTPPQILSIWNFGPGTLNWQITVDYNWLNVSPTNGQSSGQYNEVALTIDGIGLVPGSYGCILTISDPNGSDWIRYIPVNLIVGSTWRVPSQCPTIQAAIDAADNNDLVLVDDGIYTGDGNRDLDFHGKMITVKSANGPENCIIDCNGSEDEPHAAFYFHTGEKAKSIVNGLTLTNGYTWNSGAIFCMQSGPTILNCKIIGNLSGSNGGGINIYRGNPIITGCEIVANSAFYGGGVFGYETEVVINHCIIKDNSAGWEGGGLLLESTKLNVSTVTECIISGNSANSSGGGVIGFESKITNCTIVGNSARDYYGGGVFRCSVPIKNCIVWNNAAGLNGDQIYNSDAPTYSCIQGDCNGIGNISADPCFVDPGYWANANDPNIIVEPNDPNAIWVDGDYHLLQSSTCINTGDPNYVAGFNETDLDGLPRIIGGRIDMGAYEFNHIPIADAGPNQVAYADLTGLVEITLDGSGSYDTDGGDLTYLWTWAVDGNTYEANGVSPTIQLPVGEHIIELIVNDGIDDSESDYVTVTVTGPMQSYLWLFPQVIHRNNPGPEKIMALLSLPDGITKNQIDTSRLLSLYPCGIEAVSQYIFNIGSPRCGNQHAIIFACFDKGQLLDAIPDNGPIELQAVGRLKTGRYFFGSDTITIKHNQPKRWPPWR